MKLVLKSPLKEVRINQWFGNNLNPTYKQQGLPGHNGIDFYALHGTPIYSSHDGYAYYQVDGGGGHGVVIITDKEYEYESGTCHFKTIYWHLPDPLKEPKYASPIANKTGGVFVKAGDLIGYADNTGNSTGDHLHFGLKPVAKGEDNSTWYNLAQANGYAGAIDPAPYLEYEPPIFSGIIKRGDENTDVQIMQAYFIRNKYLGPIYIGFGYYGPKTQKAVKQFQIDNGIPNNNGVQCGPLTLAKLTELIKSGK